MSQAVINGKSTIPKHHHYVTRAYLEGFLERGNPHLYVYKRDEARFFRAAPEKVAKISHYYSLRRKDGTWDGSLESLLQSKIEDPGLHVIRKLNGGHRDLSAHARARLAILMAVQEHRVPWSRQVLQGIYSDALKHFHALLCSEPEYLKQSIAKHLAEHPEYGNVTQDDLLEAFQNSEIEATPVASLQAIFDLADSLAHIYFSMKWTIHEAQTASFVTSDCPVHRYYRPVRLEMPFTGLADDRVQVRFPLSTKRMLILTPDEKRIARYASLKKRGLHRQANLLKARAGPVFQVSISAEEVESLNRHTASMAEKLVFSPSEKTYMAEHFVGACQNMRSQTTVHPGGLLQLSSVYPQR